MSGRSLTQKRHDGQIQADNLQTLMTGCIARPGVATTVCTAVSVILKWLCHPAPIARNLQLQNSTGEIPLLAAYLQSRAT
jgi:hypothetical protein